MAEAVEALGAARVRVRCTYCHDGIERGSAAHCAACLAPHHPECHAAHGRCSAPGCGDRRVLVADPDGRPAPPASATCSKTRTPRRRRALALLLGALTLAGPGLWLAAEEPAVEVVVAPPATPPTVVEVAPAREPVPVRVLERATRDVALSARDFRLPVMLEEGERLVVTTDERGYTLVVCEPPPGSGRHAEVRFVAEPTDPVEVVASGSAGTRERVRAGPGEVIALERVGDDLLKIAVLAER